jgi:hypothetical protein
MTTTFVSFDSTRFGTSLCRACKEDREETSHLIAFCDGLAHPRMRVFGRAMLDPHFEWQPHQLLSMIEIIDKLVPEEGTYGNIPTANDRPDGLEDIGLTNAHE